MKRLFLLSFLAFLVHGLSAQVPLAIGEWQSLQSFRTGAYVTETPNAIAYSTGRAVFFVDKEDLSITRLNRESGLAETGIRLLRYHGPTETLIIVYDNSVIDLFRNGNFSTLRQIDNFNFSGGDNSINDLFFGPGNIVYIAAGYGVSALDLANETFPFTTFTGVSVNGVAEFGGSLFAATDEGLYQVPRQGVNLNDFSNWQLIDLTIDGMMIDYTSTAVNVYSDDLYFGVNENVWRWNNGNPTLHYDVGTTSTRLQYLSSGPFYLLAGYQFTDANFDRRLVLITPNGFDREIVTNCIGISNYALQETNGRIWIGDESDGIRYLPNAGSPSCEVLTYPGPFSDRNYRLAHDGTSLWVASGTITINLSPTGNRDGLFRFKDGEWTTYNRTTQPTLAGRDEIPNNRDDLADYVSVAIDPNNDKVWVGTFLEGAFSLDRTEETIELFDEANSSLGNAVGEVAGRVRVGEIDVDPAGNVYFPNTLADHGRPISVRSPDGQWISLGGDCGRNEAFSVAVDEAGFIWALHGINAGGGITVLDPGEDLFSRDDDECRLILPSNSQLPVNEVRSIAIDLNGEVWIGTSQGVMVFDCGGVALNAEACDGREIVVEDEIGNTGLLLETEDCFSITVDGANRKWVGTGGGAYLLSPDGREQLAFFDEDNSPLLDNFVRDIAINPQDGTVYFGTEDGITSFRGEATQAGIINRAELVVFPNPVEPNYDGPIAIEGVARDANIKITDISGKLVFETEALGGQVLWDGTDYNGRRVQSGVYLVFASTNGRFRFDNPDAAVGKIVFIR
ncbi:MAG: hypothetical protein AAF828_00520 [Bacteroidota bacterium]